MRIAALAVALILAAGAARSQAIAGCSKVERQAVSEALRNAKRLTLAAAAAVGDTPEYTRWFGKYSARNSETVRATLKGVFGAIRSGRVASVCRPFGVGACAPGTYAFVYSDEPYRVHVCPNFFNLPTMASLEPGTGSGDNGTREGTFIHEISHFEIVAATEDNCYSRTDCSRMARSHVADALQNADSYQYFTEDVTHFRETTLADKPE